MNTIIPIIIIICTAIIIIVLVLTRTNSDSNNNICNNKKPKKLLEENFDDKKETFVLEDPEIEIAPILVKKSEIAVTESGLNDYIKRVNLFSQVDQLVDSDNLTAPIQRYPTNYYPQPPLARVTNIVTQGLPDSYSFLGNLYREYDNKIVKLYGRRRYDDYWDYYGVLNSSDNLPTKVNINTKNNKPLYEGDEVKIPMFKERGEFKVFLNKEDQFAYSPYVF
jgi:hypothetical protein